MCNGSCHFTFSWSLLIAHHVAKVLMTSSWHVQLPHLSGFIFTSMGTSENFELKLALRALVTLIYVDIRKSDINCSHAPGRVTEQVKIVRISTNDCGWNIYITQSTLFPHSKWYNHRIKVKPVYWERGWKQVHPGYKWYSRPEYCGFSGYVPTIFLLKVVVSLASVNYP